MFPYKYHLSWLRFIGFTILVALIVWAMGCVSMLAVQRQYDGEYDNTPFLVDGRTMKLSAIASSLAILHTVTKFRMPDEAEYDARLDATGTVVGDFIFTARHNVYQATVTQQVLTPMGLMDIDIDAERLSEQTYLLLGNDYVALDLVFLSEETDVVIFKIPEGVHLSPYPYELGDANDLKVGDFVYLVGNPLNYGVNTRQGIVSALVAPEAIASILPRFESAFMVSNAVNPGDSGTPVVAIRDGKYELVGLAQGIFTSTQSLSWAIKINVFMEALAGL